MFEELTPAQTAQFNLYVEKWTRIGLCTERANRPRAEAAIRWMYAQANLAKPHIVWCGSPVSNALAREATRHLVTNSSTWDAEDSVGKYVLESVHGRMGHRVRDRVWESVVGKIGDRMREKVWESLGRSIGDSVGESVRASVQNSVRKYVGESVEESVGESLYGQHDAAWLGFYDFFRTVCGLTKETDPLHGLWELAHSSNWALPHKQVCWISERPHSLHHNARGQLHRDGGVAIQYPDGFGIYALNGVRMEPWMVETSPGQLNSQQVLAVANAEQRRELIRKVGVERLLSALSYKILDRRGEMYELLSIRLSEDLTDARVLKMRNPSIGVFHLERVEDGLETVEQALNWRNQDHEPTEVLT